jgi:hypothetical protein
VEARIRGLTFHILDFSVPLHSFVFHVDDFKRTLLRCFHDHVPSPRELAAWNFCLCQFDSVCANDGRERRIVPVSRYYLGRKYCSRAVHHQEAAPRPRCTKFRCFLAYLDSCSIRIRCTKYYFQRPRFQRLQRTI